VVPPKCSEIYLTAEKNRQSLNKAIKYFFSSAWKVNCSENVNTDNVFREICGRNSLQQAQITELTETMFSVSTV